MSSISPNVLITEGKGGDVPAAANDVPAAAGVQRSDQFAVPEVHTLKEMVENLDDVDHVVQRASGELLVSTGNVSSGNIATDVLTDKATEASGDPIELGESCARSSSRFCRLRCSRTRTCATFRFFSADSHLTTKDLGEPSTGNNVLSMTCVHVLTIFVLHQVSKCMGP